MLTKRQNLLETIHGGNPDRYVNMFEAFGFTSYIPFSLHDHRPNPGDLNVVNSWGVTRSWPVGNPGPFPIHTADRLVVKDIAEWQRYVKAPQVVYDAKEWEQAIAHAEKIDRNEQFVTATFAPGIFENIHYLCEMQNTLMAFYEEPEALQELIEFLGEWEISYAQEVCKYLKPDCLFQHDDWGSQISTFISPDMFEEFLLPVYQKVYGYYKSHGVELIVHHSDSFAATLVPYMIEMGIDIWQGVMTTNNIPELIQKYGGQISFMGGIDSAAVDHEGWTEEEIQKKVFEACDACGKHYFIPSASQGGAMATYPGVYDALTRAINAKSVIDFAK